MLFEPPEHLPSRGVAPNPLHHPRPQRVGRIQNALPQLEYTAGSVEFLTNMANSRRDNILHTLDVAGLEIEDDPVAMKEVYEFSTMGMDGPSDEEHVMAQNNSALLHHRA